MLLFKGQLLRWTSVFLFLSVLVGCIPVSCGRNATVVAVEGDTLALSHSSLLTIVECDGYTVVDIKNPWGNGLLNRYVLVPSEKELPQGLPSGVLLRTPLSSVVLFSGVHAGVFEELGMSSAVSGVCDADYFYNNTIETALLTGAVVDCGSSQNVDVERVMQLSPDALFVLPYENGGYGKIEKMKMPVVECADYMETSPLGCAEWIRFYGRLLGCAAKADSLFGTISGEYLRLCELAASAQEKPRVMCELRYGSVWYMPAGESTTGVLYRDAGADYIFSYLEGSGSVPLAFETVLDKAVDADIWLFKYNSPMDKDATALLSEYSGYAHFKPFKVGNMFACNTAYKRLFEETAFHPERLLRELVVLFHRNLLPEYEPVYYERVQK